MLAPLRLALTLTALLVAPDEKAGPGAGTPPAGAIAPESPVEAAARRALEEGLDYLARRQAENLDGSFPRGLGKEETDEWAPVGVAAIGALAFMSAGSSPGRGPHGRALERLVQFLLAQVEHAPGTARDGYIWKQGDSLSRTHGHGFATLALAQAYGMGASPDKNGELRRALEAAVGLIERSQGPEGGWHYSPEISALHEGSVTITYVQALRAARNAGIQVNADVIHEAEDYVLRLQDEQGRFAYTLDDDRTTVALTAAGIATLNMAGRYDDDAVQSGVDVILRALAEDPDRTGIGTIFEDRGVPRFRFYERLYVSQAFWQLTDPTVFQTWFARERERILRSQHTDGSWRCKEYGDCYATAVNCLVLALPEGLLPIFQR